MKRVTGVLTHSGLPAVLPAVLPAALRVSVALLVTSFLITGCAGDKKRKIPKEFVTGERISIMTAGESLRPDPELASTTVRLPEAQAVPEWPQPGGNANNVLHHVMAKADLKKIWKTSVGKGGSSSARVTASPIVADGKVFAMDAKAQISAIDAKTGKRLWRVSLAPKGEKGAAGFGGGLSYDMERLFVANGFGHVLALDPDTGAQIWKREFGVPFHFAPTVSSGRVFVTTVDNQLHAVSSFDGALLWSHRGISEAAGILSDTNPAVQNDMVIAPFSSGEIAALRAQNGQQAWTDQLTKSGRQTAISNISSIAGRPAVSGGQIIVVSHSGRMVAIDLRSGERIWTRNIGGTQTPWISGEYVYVVNSDAHILCITRRDGRIRWMAKLQQFDDRGEKKRIQWNGPVMAGNQLVLFSSYGRFTVLSPYTGAVLQTGKASGGVNTAPVVADGIFYVLNEDAEIVAFEGTRELSPKDSAIPPKRVDANGVIDASGNSGGSFPWFGN